MNGLVEFSLRELERTCLAREHANALAQVHAMLEAMERADGDLRIAEPMPYPDDASHVAAMLARIAAAVSSLFGDAGFVLSRPEFDRLIPLHPFLCALFASSPFGHADHVMRAMSSSTERDGIVLAPGQLLKFLLMVTPESEIRLDIETLWQEDATASASLFLSLLACRFTGTPAAHRKREILLDWLPTRLDTLGARIEELPIGLFHRVAAYSSCALQPGKHDIKRPLNAMTRAELLGSGRVAHLLESRPEYFCERIRAGRVEGQPV